MKGSITTIFLLVAMTVGLIGEDGYRLWLRYDPLEYAVQRAEWATRIGAVKGYGKSSTIDVAIEELETGLSGLLRGGEREGAVTVVVGSVDALPEPWRHALREEIDEIGQDGYLVRLVAAKDGSSGVVITGASDVGVLYGAFAFLRHVQTARPLENLTLRSEPRIQHRVLNHWDNLDRSVERGQAGQSLWEWFQLPDYLSPRYRDYARANASIGINGTVLTNVNANALVLTAEYLRKAAALADVFRPYGIRVYLTARFSAPIEIGGLETADPLDPEVQAWWSAKAEEIYHYIPDFGGFLVKANSEGQPGPQNYGRSHADGANLLADAVAPHGGIVMWRAFVYSEEIEIDRHKQAYDEFVPLDGQFRSNVIVQVKNGAIDFMPREPFHPLFGAMPGTPLAMELQITQEYLGGAIHLAFLGPLFEEALDADTFVSGPGSTVARVVDGSLHRHEVSAIAGVANMGSVRNWTGNPLAAANWYAFGRLAWDPGLPSAQIAEEWTRMTFSNRSRVRDPITSLLLESREAVVNYSMPLGLHHIMARGHHYGPGPWVDGGRPDWTSVYYHRADEEGIGFDRTASGSHALEQYAPAVAERWGNRETCPSELLLWFHHLGWDDRTPSGLTVWEDLGAHMQKGVDTVRRWRTEWDHLAPMMDEERHAHVAALLARQEREAVEWKDANLLYFQTFSKRPWPSRAEEAEETLEHYRSVERHFVPGDPAGR